MTTNQTNEIAGTLAHEINNPLAIIQGSAAQIKDMAQRKHTDPIALIKIAERIEKMVFRISHVVRGLKGQNSVAVDLPQGQPPV